MEFNTGQIVKMKIGMATKKAIKMASREGMNNSERPPKEITAVHR
jgi:hypothetical protein